MAEQKIILSPDAAVEEQAKIGELIGADYLIVGSLSKAFLQNERRILEATGQSNLASSGVFSIEFRIIVMPTRQIKWADVLTVPMENVVFRPDESDSGSRMDRACAVVADQIANRIMENIYPIRIAAIQSNGELILNQGGSSLNAGQILDVYALGDVIIDEGYTGEPLGRSETWIAKLQIVRVTPKTAYAVLIQGNIEGMDYKKAICRRLADAISALPAQANEGSHTSEVAVQPEGGVKMPFDQ
jgi:hypothetical protein